MKQDGIALAATFNAEILLLRVVETVEQEMVDLTPVRENGVKNVRILVREAVLIIRPSHS